MRDLIGYALYSLVGLIGIVLMFTIFTDPPAEPAPGAPTTEATMTEETPTGPTPGDALQLAEELDDLSDRLREGAESRALDQRTHDRMSALIEELNGLYPYHDDSEDATDAK